MQSINMNTILKNLTAILCVLMIVALLFPFASFSVTASVAGYSAEGESESASGFDFVFGSGFLGILFGLIPIIILAGCYLPQIAKYKKYISLSGSILGIILLFLVPGQYSSSASAEVEGVSSTIEASTKYQLGFYLILIFLIIQIAISVIQFFNLKGNKVFDTINAENSITSENPNFNTEKISDITKNVAETIKNATSNISLLKVDSSNIQHTVEPHVSQHVKQHESNPTVSFSEQYTTETANSIHNNAVKHTDTEAQKTPEEIMELIEKLFKMKESGILTEEEFTEKKQKLLSNIII